MIIGNNQDFFVQCDVLIGQVETNGYVLGPINFWIDGKAYPGKGQLITLSSIIPLLSDLLKKTINWKFKESNLPINQINFDKEEIENENILSWYLSELFDFGLSMKCEIVGENIRIFYKCGDDSYKEKVIALSYYKKIIEQLESWLDEQYR